MGLLSLVIVERVMATERTGAASGSTGLAADLGGDVPGRKADDSLSLSACSSSLANSDRKLKKQKLFQTLLLSVASLIVLRCKTEQDSEEHLIIDVIDIRAAFPLSEAIHCRLKKLFAVQDIEGWVKLLPQKAKAEDVIESIFMLAEQQLILVAEAESLKCRKEAFALLLEENKQLLAQEREKSKESELEKAELRELDTKMRSEVEHLQKEVAQLNKQIAVLLGELEQLKRKEMEGDIRLREGEVALIRKWELERQELRLRVSELEAAQQLGRKEQPTQDTVGEEISCNARVLREELAKARKDLSGSKEKAAILMEMCKQNNARIEELVMENAKLKSELSTVEPTSKNHDVAAVLRENSNLRAALKTLERMKMEVENEKVAIQDQLLEYQRMCGVFDKPHPPIATYKRASEQTGAGKTSASADGIVRGTVTPSPRACPFCKTEFSQLGSDESDFMDHVSSCQGLGTP